MTERNGVNSCIWLDKVDKEDPELGVWKCRHPDSNCLYCAHENNLADCKYKSKTPKEYTRITAQKGDGRISEWIS